ncbi:MAG TPA: hypothetical protein P5328_01120 [Candidatus Paceibacterota bacterium]|nr:hypothetical protein [Candidatus Paceibacterota bacterium]HRZ34587.1 hypothetical protein [Candidatus Paceibacterota bacterium]
MNVIGAWMIAGCIGILAIFSALVGVVKVKENKPVEQLSRWTWFVLSRLFVGALAYAATINILATFSDSDPNWAWYFGGILVGLSVFALMIELTHKSALFRLAGNKFALATDIFFGRRATFIREDMDCAIRTYRIYLGGLNAKFDWEIVEIVDEFNRDVIDTISSTVEFEDSPGLLSGKYTLRPDPERLQYFAATNVDTAKRDALLKEAFGGYVRMYLSDFLKTKKIDGAMATKGTLFDELPESVKTELRRQEEKYGVKLNTRIIDNIDYPPELAKVNEQISVMARIREMVNFQLESWGKTKEQIEGKADRGNVTPEERKEAERLVLAITEQVPERTLRHIIDGRLDSKTAGKIILGINSGKEE